MDPFPRISVIIPTFNRLPLLQDAAASVLEQTYRNFELIIADDGSTDGTGRYCRELEARTGMQAGENNPHPSPAPSPPVRYLHLEHTGMPGAVRNRGAEAARGEYLAFLDSDDLWSPKKLEKQVALMGECREDTSRGDTYRMHSSRVYSGRMYECRFSHTRERWLRRVEDGEFREISQKGQKHRRSGDIFDDALKKCIIGPSTVMMERALFEELGGFREDLEIAEDYEFWLRVAALEEVGYLDEPLTIKRAGYGDQLSEKYGHIEYFRLTGLKALVDSGWFDALQEKKAGSAAPKAEAEKRNGIAEAARKELARKCLIYAAGCRKRGREEEALQYERWAKQYQGESAQPESAQPESAP